MNPIHEAAIAVIEEQPDAAELLARAAAYLQAKEALNNVVD